MHAVFQMRGTYVQGPDAIADVGEYVAPLGEHALVMGGATALSVTEGAILEGLASRGVGCVVERFRGTHADEETARLAGIASGEGADIIIGVGGGQALDTSKAVARQNGARLVSVPTVASTDAPCAGGPDVVLVDTRILLQSPVRLTVSGMGDALSTKFEAEACAQSSAPNFRSGHATELGLACARLCYDLVMEHGIEAKRSAEEGRLTDSFESIVEANTLLSGAGYENCGLSVAHGLWEGFKQIDAVRELDVYHGELVGFFTLVQLALEGRPQAYLREVMEFCAAVNLPVSLSDDRICDLDEATIHRGIDQACRPGSSMHHVPFVVEPEHVREALLEVDALGRELTVS